MNTPPDLGREAGRALARADSAHQKIEAHEDLCAVRYKALEDALAELKSAVGGQYKLLWGIVLSFGGTAMVTLVAIVLKAVKLA
jgi:hypothetical protein